MEELASKVQKKMDELTNLVSNKMNWQEDKGATMEASLDKLTKAVEKNGGVEEKVNKLVYRQWKSRENLKDMWCTTV